MYDQMRVSGQTGGFMLDAIAAVDIALWDLAGKIHRAPIAALISGRAAKPRLASYVNYLAGDTRAERLERARTYREAGCRRFKIFYDASKRELLECYDALAAICGPENIAVDAQWRLDPKTAPGVRRGAGPPRRALAGVPISAPRSGASCRARRPHPDAAGHRGVLPHAC